MQSICARNKKQEEFTVVASAAYDEQATKAEQTMHARTVQANRTPETLTAQQLKIRNAAKEAFEAVDSIWEDIDAYRAENNEAYRLEKEAEKTAARNTGANAANELRAQPAAVTDETRLNNFLGQFKGGSNTTSAPVSPAVSNTPVTQSSTGFAIRSRGVASSQSLASSNSAVSIKSRNENAVAENRKDDAAQAVQSDIADNKTKTDNNNSEGSAAKSNTNSDTNASGDVKPAKTGDNPLALVTGVTGSADKKKSDTDKDGNGIDDRVEQGVAAQSEVADKTDKVENTDKKKSDDKDGNGIDDRTEQGVAALQSDNPWAAVVGNESGTSAENISKRNAEAVAENRMDDAAQVAQAEITATPTEKAVDTRYSQNTLKVDNAAAEAEKNRNDTGRGGRG
jgi:hypothetical protein